MEIIILRVTPFKENDGIIFGLTHDELITFNARALFKINSKNTILNTPLLLAELDLEKNKKTGKFILNGIYKTFTPLNNNFSLSTSSSISFLNEIILKLLNDNEKVACFNLIKNCLFCLKNEDMQILTCLYFLLKVISLIGYGFEVNHCVFCGSKTNISAFSYSEGGFICKNCLSSLKSDLNIEEMKLIHDLIISNDIADLEKFKIRFPTSIIYSLFKKSCNYIERIEGINIKSLFLFD